MMTVNTEVSITGDASACSNRSTKERNFYSAYNKDFQITDDKDFYHLSKTENSSIYIGLLRKHSLF